MCNSVAKRSPCTDSCVHAQYAGADQARFKRRWRPPARRRGHEIRTGSRRVPVGFRAAFPPLYERSEAGLSGPVPDFRSPGNPRGIPNSAVKVRAFRCLCVVVAERPPGVPTRAAPPSWPEVLVRRHTTTLGLKALFPARAAAASPSTRGRWALAPVADTAWAPPRGFGARTFLSLPLRGRPGRFHHAVSARTIEDQVRSPLDSASGPDSVFSPRPGESVLAPLQARTGTGRGGNAESNHSASTRQQQTYRRSTAWSQAGLRGRRFRRQRRPARATERSARRPAPRSVTRPNE
jgi:hypothetical protein